MNEDPFGISKKKKPEHALSGSTIAGAGAVTAGTGLAAGGLPGAKSDFSSVFRMKPADRSGGKLKQATSQVKGALPARKAVPGGILGFRISAHEGGTYGFREQAKADAGKRVKSNSEAFFRGRNAGKIAPEENVLRHMKHAKKAGNVALIGGAAATAYGIKRSREVHKAAQHEDKYNGALMGVGGTGAVLSHGGSKVLTGQKKTWERAATASVDEAGKLVPALSGREGKKLTLKQMHQHKTRNPGMPFPKTMYPSVSDSAVKNHPDLLSGVSRKTAEKAGALRGAAAQQRHFAEVYGSTSKVVRAGRTPSLILAGAGAGGAVASRLKGKDSLKKNSTLSAFGVDHG